LVIVRNGRRVDDKAGAVLEREENETGGYVQSVGQVEYKANEQGRVFAQNEGFNRILQLFKVDFLLIFDFLKLFEPRLTIKDIQVIAKSFTEKDIIDYT
jgi:hypothetical protein